MTSKRKMTPEQIIRQVERQANAPRYARMKKSPTQDALAQVLLVLDPESSGLYPQYLDDWSGFIEKELGGTVTPMLESLVKTVQGHRITVVKSGTGLGKSWIGSQMALAFYKIYEQSQVFLMAAPPKGNLINNLMSKLRSTVFINRGLFGDDDVKSLSVTRKPDQFIEGLVIPTHGTDEEKETRFSGKHAPHVLVILDEGDAIPDFVFSAIDGWGSGGVSFHIVVFMNPKQKSGAAYDLIERSDGDPDIAVVQMSAFDHINVIEGRQAIPGAVSRRQTVRRISEWSHPIEEGDISEDGDTELPADVFELPPFLVGEQYGRYPPLEAGYYKVLKSSPEFSYKVLGEYPLAGMGSTIPEMWIKEAMRRFDAYGRGEPRPTAPPIMGFDVADSGEDHSAVCFRWGGRYELIRWRGSDANKAVNRAIKLWKEVEPDRTFVDKSGVGAIAPGKMAEKGVWNVHGFLSQRKSSSRAETGRFRKKRDEALWAVREWLNPDNGMQPMLDKRDSRLVKSLRMLSHEVENDEIVFATKKKMKKKLGFSPDELDALMLTMARAGTIFRTIG